MDALKLFLPFIFFHLSCVLIVAQEHPISCPKDFQCGHLGHLHYPFTNISTPACGLCLVQCNPPSSQYPKIQLDHSSDQILDAITMVNDSIIKLKDPQFQRLLQNKSCNTFYYQINLPNSPSVSFKIASNMTTLFRCSNSSSKESVDRFPINIYKNFTSCDGIQIFYRNPKYRHSFTSPQVLNQRCEFHEVIDKSLGFDSDYEVLRMTTSVAELAFLCLQMEKEMRPTMAEVLETLKSIRDCMQIFEHTTETNTNFTDSRNRNKMLPFSPESEDAVLLKDPKVPSSPI